MAIDLLQENALKQLSRAELQELAKTNQIKANIKSVSIIAQLVERFPNGVPSPKDDPKSLPRKNTRTKSTKKKATSSHKRKDSSPSPSAVGSAVVDPAAPPEAAESHEPPRDNLLITVYEAAVPTRRAKTSPVQVPQEEFAEGSEGNAPNTTLDEEHPDTQDQSDSDGNVDDNLSENSEYTHAVSESSAASASDPPVNDATSKYVVDIIRANAEADKKLHDTVMSLIHHARDAKMRLEEMNKRLLAEREHRERIVKYLLYHIPNNNRWRTGKHLAEDVRQEYLSNGGRGWKDMGEWEYEEIWGHEELLMAPDGEEISASYEEEYFRKLQEEDEMREQADADDSVPPEDLPDPAAEEDSAHSPVDASNDFDSQPSASNKRKRIEIRDFLPSDLRGDPRKRPRLDEEPAASSSPPPSRSIKGKGRMSAKDNERLALEQAAEEELRRAALRAEELAETEKLHRRLAESMLASEGTPAAPLNLKARTEERQRFRTMLWDLVIKTKDGKCRDTSELRKTLVRAALKAGLLQDEMVRHMVETLTAPEIAEQVLAALRRTMSLLELTQPRLRGVS